MDKQKYIEYAKREWIAVNIETIYETEDKAVYMADTEKYGSVVMKMNDDVHELLQEFAALVDLEGDNCAKAYNCVGGEMTVEERIFPGNKLREVLDTDERLSYFVETFNCIHKTPKNEKMYPTYIDWLESAVESCIQFNVEVDISYKMKIAREIGAELFDKYSERVLLHGDLHHDNILLNKCGKYSIIDPKGVIGPRIFDIPRFVLNELDENLNKTGKQHILYVINELSKALYYDEKDIKKLFFIEVMLANIWCIEDDEEIDEDAINMAYEILNEN